MKVGILTIPPRWRHPNFTKVEEKYYPTQTRTYIKSKGEPIEQTMEVQADPARVPSKYPLELPQRSPPPTPPFLKLPEIMGIGREQGLTLTSANAMKI